MPPPKLPSSLCYCLVLILPSGLDGIYFFFSPPTSMPIRKVRVFFLYKHNMCSASVENFGSFYSLSQFLKKQPHLLPLSFFTFFLNLPHSVMLKLSSLQCASNLLIPKRFFFDNIHPIFWYYCSLPLHFFWFLWQYTLSLVYCLSNHLCFSLTSLPSPQHNYFSEFNLQPFPIFVLFFWDSLNSHDFTIFIS